MEIDHQTKRIVKSVINNISPYLNEKQVRLLNASFALALGYGGQKVVSELSGISRVTINKGLKELEDGPLHAERSSLEVKPGQIRAQGGGRPSALKKFPNLFEAIEEIITKRGLEFGSPMSVLRWTTLSIRKIVSALKEYGIDVSANVVCWALTVIGYSKQLNQKMLQVGLSHESRDEQFTFINKTAQECIDEGIPCISVDCKKKENLGNFKNQGQEYCPVGEPRSVLDHDFAIPELGTVAPYGVYVVNDNTAFVNLGTSHDTAEFAVESIRRWYNIIGRNTFPNAKRIYITCDGGGSNGSRNSLWKQEIQELANELEIEIMVSHFPPGTSKWNKIEHRLFCYISKNWQGQPLIDIETVVNLINSTTTTKGLTVKCVVDETEYKTGIKVTKEQKASLKIEYTGPEQWNYIIRPNV